MASQEELDRWFAWRDGERRKHRTMTMSEYLAWERGGDILSSPIESNSFPGGLTILFESSPVLGKVRGGVPPPKFSDSGV
jgi:hypothetical protein